MSFGNATQQRELFICVENIEQIIVFGKTEVSSIKFRCLLLRLKDNQRHGKPTTHFC